MFKKYISNSYLKKFSFLTILWLALTASGVVLLFYGAISILSFLFSSNHSLLELIVTSSLAFIGLPLGWFHFHIAKHLKKYISTQKKGWEGEQLFYKLDSLNIKHKRLTDLDLITPDGEKSQIDALIILPKVVICVEIKNRASYYVDKDGKWYSLKFKKWVNTRSPIAQNEYHCKFIKSLLYNNGFSTDVWSLVVLTDPRGEYRLENLKVPHKTKLITLDEVGKTIYEISSSSKVDTFLNLDSIENTILKYQEPFDFEKTIKKELGYFIKYLIE
ncbi:NERD domain protein [Desulforamulus reducens MI-1]|uniref:NERD domain protein n=1 Tax=Desulforamulus reducens (strain ATCC BAA-1160 / DSM 100696 / MI-1) TaxID=349161 RepID=A4J2V5_DESRM|nr:nuclease-related domain-containing protein [Desulforamulus reducens]ABO49408.1 NERD domain protein [Desulforamulus reducens MI-1]